jgi:cobalamin synthase
VTGPRGALSGARTALSGARGALAFLTPLGRAAPADPSAVGGFPAVGAAIGALLGLVWWAAAKGWAPVVAAAIVVVLDLALTGLLHLDGLVDSADGLLSHLSRERRLEVMREPGAGAFGVGAGAAVLLLRWAALAALTPSVLLLAGTYTASRSVMSVVVRAVPYARAEGGGLATAFLTAGDRTAAPGPVPLAGVLGVAAAGALLIAWHPVAGTVSLLAGLAAAVGVVLLACRRLGGFTGDVLGAAGVVLETVTLVVAAARW